MTWKLTADDRWEIQDLYTRYCWLLDTGQAEAWADLFTDDGHHAGSRGTYARGRAELIAHVERVAPVLVGKQHWNTNIDVVATGPDEAVGRCYMAALMATEAPQIGVAGASVERIGRYFDRLVRQDGRWLFAEKIVESHFSGAESTAGLQHWPRFELTDAARVTAEVQAARA